MSTEEGLDLAIGDGWPEAVGLIVLEETDSTMAEARRRAGELTVPTWIMAERQTAGHGRRGRPWRQPAGNLAATLLLPRPGTAAEAAQRSFTAALALRAALTSRTRDGDSVTLKWPNDVLLNDGKVAGILLEGSGQGNRMDWVAVGFGVNLVAAPPVSELEPGAVPAVSLAGVTGARVAGEDLLRDLARAFHRRERLMAEQGFAPVLTEWLAHAARLGREITARTGRETLRGIFETVDETGNLVLRTPDGLRRIAAADVYFD